MLHTIRTTNTTDRTRARERHGANRNGSKQRFLQTRTRQPIVRQHAHHRKRNHQHNNECRQRLPAIHLAPPSRASATHASIQCWVHGVFCSPPKRKQQHATAISSRGATIKCCDQQGGRRCDRHRQCGKAKPKHRRPHSPFPNRPACFPRGPRSPATHTERAGAFAAPTLALRYYRKLYSPSAFFSADTRRRLTGIFSSTPLSVSSSVPPATGSISSTMDRFTR